jgi:hypothetical protein
MTLQNVTGHVLIPESVYYSGSMAQQPAVLDANGEYCCCVFRIPKTGTLKKIAFRTGTVTTADTITVRLEAVDVATGQPDGNLLVANANGEQAAPSANTTYWVALNGATGVSVTKGTVAAIKISLTFVDGNLQINYRLGNNPRNFPYCGEYLGAAWALKASLGNFGLEYDTGIVPVIGMLPAVSITGVAFANNDDPERRGLVFQVPYTCTIHGIWVVADMDEGCNIVLYDTDQATPLETISTDKDIRGGTGAGLHIFELATDRTLTINTNYRISLEPTTNTDITLSYADLTDDGAVVAMAGFEGGTTWHYTTAADVPVNEASWAPTTTRRPLIGIMISQLDDGATAGGGAVVGPFEVGPFR